MAKYEDIMEGPWINTTLYPESIPHLFHYDLAYLWVLEKQNDQRPSIWEERIDGWRCLIELLLIGELEVIEEPIREPLLKYTRPLGITSVFWVALRNSAEKIGVLSPTVLVRPLPDFKTDDLRGWKQELRGKSRPDEFRYFVHLAVEYLQQGQVEGSFRDKIATILENEFTPGPLSVPPSGTSSSSLQVPILTKLTWSHKPGESSSIETIELLVRGAGNGRKVYVPRCRECSYLLTKPSSSLPIEVQTDRFQVMCENPSGGHLNEEPLSDFLIWLRNEAQVVVWDRQGILEIPVNGLPPEPVIQGVQVEFEWNGAQLGGEREKRFLKLQFPRKELLKQRIDTILYKKIIVPGKFEGFSGLPIRPEWLDAVGNPDQIEIRPDPANSKVTFSNLEVKGWPVAISRSFSGRSLLQHEADLAVGIYPNPQFVPDKWQWYRLLLHGSTRQKFYIDAGWAREILPGLKETTVGLNKCFSVRSSGESDVGVTYWIRAEHKRFSSDISAAINLGIDFGTTNTIVYYLPPGKEIDDVLNRPTDFSLSPSKSVEWVQWLAEIEGDKSHETIGNFLPGPEYLKDRLDPHIIPSALWKFDDKYLIRWDATKPTAGAKEMDGFKWDDRGIDNSTLRFAFMEELLFLALPSILQSAVDSGAITTWNLIFNLGFAFPLSFGDEARKKMIALQTRMRSDLAELTGFNFDLHSINESSACQILLGSPNSTDAFLVADMGGGTIDIALFTADSTEAEQIGSIRFAGETYLKVLTEKRSIDYWEIRDLISRGKCHHHYGGDQMAQRILRKFIGIAFEFLRTMIEAYRIQRADQTIHLVLAGNGWHLVEAFSRETQSRSPRQVFGDYYQHVVKLLGDQKIKPHPALNLASNKHLVAIGALKHAERRRGDELNSSDPIVTQLPAGRGLKFGSLNDHPKEIKWSDLIGHELPFEITTSVALRKLDLHVYFEEMPPMPQQWKNYIYDVFNVTDENQIPRPNELRLNEHIRTAIEGDPPKLTKGPLQITVEHFWVDWLKN